MQYCSASRAASTAPTRFGSHRMAPRLLQSSHDHKARGRIVIRRRIEQPSEYHNGCSERDYPIRRGVGSCNPWFSQSVFIVFPHNARICAGGVSASRWHGYELHASFEQPRGHGRTTPSATSTQFICKPSTGGLDSAYWTG